MSPSSQDPHPRAPRSADARSLGLIACVALVIGNMIGSGIFLLPASLAPYGWNAVVGWLVTIAGSIALARCIAILAARSPDLQDPPALVEAALGRPVGFAIGWSYWVSIWTSNAAIAIAAVSYASLFVPALKNPGVGAGGAIALVWALTAVNLAGARSASGVQIVTLALKLVPLLAVLLLAIHAVADGTPLAPFVLGDLHLKSANEAAALTLWAMLGFESASCAAAKARDPQRTVPRATVLGTFATGMLYLLTCSAITLMLPSASVAASNAPFADFVAQFFGPVSALFIGALAIVSAVGALNGWTLLQGEVPLAMARRGDLPAWLARTDLRGTPGRALLVSSACTTVLLIANALRSLGDLFVFMILLSTSATLWMYLACAAATLRRRLIMPVALFGFLYALWTLWGAGLTASLLSLVLMLAGMPLFLWLRRGSSRAAAAAAAPPGE